MKALTERWKKEQQERIEASRLFDVVEENGQLLIVKRQKPVIQRTTMTFCIMLVWCFISWQVFSSPINRNSWWPWGILWFLSFPIYWLLVEAREAWRVWKTGDIWVFDKTADTVSYNGRILVNLSNIKCVKAKESLDAESERAFYLYLVPKQGKEITFNYYGFAGEWSDVLEAAKQISEYGGLQIVQERASF